MEVSNNFTCETSDMASCIDLGKPINHKKSPFYEAVKRTADIICALFSLLMFLPLFLGIAIAIKAESKGPVFFSQTRCGKDGKPFKMLKFRSMVQNAEDLKKQLLAQNEMSGPVFKIKDDPRITKVGKFIRKTSLDELPQLVNILKGDMTIVGPRPPIDKEVLQYTDHQMQRLLVKPGLTCYWQVGGRNNIDFDNWVELDIKYIKERNLFVDAVLVLKTFKVFLGDENCG